MFSVDSIVNELTVGFLSLIAERMRQNRQHGLLTRACVGGGAGYCSIPFPRQRTLHGDRRGHHGLVSKRTGAGSLLRGDLGRCEKVLWNGHWKDPAQAFTRFRAETTRCTIVFGHTSGVALGLSGTSHGDIHVRREVAQICPKAGSHCEASPPSTKRKQRFRTRQDRWVGSVSIATSERETLASPETLLLSLHA